MKSLTAFRTGASLDELLVPDGDAWTPYAGTDVDLAPTPLERQPSAYVQASWREREHGSLDHLHVRAACTDDVVALRLAWRQNEPRRAIDDTNVYADACAVLFPADGSQADLATMGSPEQPVVGWHWRAGTADPFAIRACGIGTVERSRGHGLRARSRWADGEWQVVLTCPRRGDAPRFLPTIPVGFAVWAGSSDERAGLKAHTPSFLELTMEGTT